MSLSGPHGGSRQVSVSFPLGVLEVVSTAMIDLGMLIFAAHEFVFS